MSVCGYVYAISKVCDERSSGNFRFSEYAHLFFPASRGASFYVFIVMCMCVDLDGF